MIAAPSILDWFHVYKKILIVLNDNILVLVVIGENLGSDEREPVASLSCLRINLNIKVGWVFDEYGALGNAHLCLIHLSNAIKRADSILGTTIYEVPARALRADSDRNGCHIAQ